MENGLGGTTALRYRPSTQWDNTDSSGTPRLAFAVAVTALFATVFSFWVLTAAQRVLSAALSSVVLAFEPVAAAVISVLLGQDLG